MKRFGILAAGLCAAFVLTACDTTESQNTKTTSAGAVGTKSSCCAGADAKACTADGKTCSGDAATCSKGAACCKAAATKNGSMGAVGDAKPECTKTCPATGAATKSPNMGAVGDDKPAGCPMSGGCCAGKKAS